MVGRGRYLVSGDDDGGEGSPLAWVRNSLKMNEMRSNVFQEHGMQKGRIKTKIWKVNAMVS